MSNALNFLSKCLALYTEYCIKHHTESVLICKLKVWTQNTTHANIIKYNPQCQGHYVCTWLSCLLVRLDVLGGCNSPWCVWQAPCQCLHRWTAVTYNTIHTLYIYCLCNIQKWHYTQAIVCAVWTTSTCGCIHTHTYARTHTQSS